MVSDHHDNESPIQSDKYLSLVLQPSLVLKPVGTKLQIPWVSGLCPFLRKRLIFRYGRKKIPGYFLAAGAP